MQIVPLVKIRGPVFVKMHARVGIKPLAIDSPLFCTAVHFLHTLRSFLSAMLRFLKPQPKTDECQEKISAMVQQKISAMVQHLKATFGARRKMHRAAYSKKAGADWDSTAAI